MTPSGAIAGGSGVQLPRADYLGDVWPEFIVKRVWPQRGIHVDFAYAAAFYAREFVTAFTAATSSSSSSLYTAVPPLPPWLTFRARAMRARALSATTTNERVRSGGTPPSSPPRS